MALKSIKTILAEASLVAPEQFQEWSKAWRTAVEGGSTESLLGFFARENGISEEQFLQRLDDPGDIHNDAWSGELPLSVARELRDGVAVIKPADLAADPPVVLVVFRFTKDHTNPDPAGVLV